MLNRPLVIDPGCLMALPAGAVEFFGGLAVVFGLLVRPAAAALAFAMLIAILEVPLGKGFIAAQGGYEYALALMFSGAGRDSADAAMGPRLAETA